MTKGDFEAILHDINDGVEGDGFSIDVYIAGNPPLRDYEFVRYTGALHTIVELGRDESPPLFVDLVAIAAVQLCS